MIIKIKLNNLNALWHYVSLDSEHFSIILDAITLCKIFKYRNYICLICGCIKRVCRSAHPNMKPTLMAVYWPVIVLVCVMDWWQTHNPPTPHHHILNTAELILKNTLPLNAEQLMSTKHADLMAQLLKIWTLFGVRSNPGQDKGFKQ